MTTRNLPDWLKYYLKYTQNSEPPIQYHLWSGIAAISSCLRRKCWSYWAMSGGNIYPNFYIALVGPPGGRKGTAMRFAKDMLFDVDIPMSSDCLGSPQALYREMMDSEDNYINDDGIAIAYKSLSAWSEEFQVFLSDSKGDFIKIITDLFDCPRCWKYSTLARKIEDVSNCWLTIIGAITPSLLQENLTSTAVGGGLFSRIIFVVGYGKYKKVPFGFLSKEEMTLQQHLTEDLQIIRNLKGQFLLTEKFIEVYGPWYMSTNSTNGVSSEKFVGYNERRAMHLKKLCMILSVSESDELIINATHFKKALHILEYTENEMGNAFYGLGRGIHADVVVDIMSTLEAKKHMTFKEILTKYQLDLTQAELIGHMNTLEAIGKVVIEENIQGQERYVWQFQEEKKKGVEYLNKVLFNEMDHMMKGEGE